MWGSYAYATISYGGIEFYESNGCIIPKAIYEASKSGRVVSYDRTDPGRMEMITINKKPKAIS